MNAATKIYELPDDQELLQQVNSVSGYLELAMPQEAYDEIQKISLHYRELPGVMHLEVIALMAMERYADAADISGWAVQEFPEIPEFYIHAGAALGALQRSHEARNIWRAAPAAMKSTGYFHFNIAWCEMEMGDQGRARRHLREAMKLDPQVEKYAAMDPHLSQLLQDGCKLG